MALDPLYGNRMRDMAQNANPALYMPPPQLQVERRPLDMQQPQMPGPPDAAAAPEKASGFPALVATQQAAAGGKKLDDATLAALKDQYLVETVMPRETAVKGSVKAQHDAAQAAYNSKADRWIKDYLAAGGEPATAQDALDKSEFGLGRTATGLKDTAVSAVKGATTDTLSGLMSLLDYGVRGIKGNVAGSVAAWKDLLGGGDLKSVDKAGTAAKSEAGAGTTVIAKGADTVDAIGEGLATAATSEATLQARKGLGELISADAPASEIAAYIAKNPSSTTGMIGESIGMMAPAFLTGGASAALRGTAIAGDLAKGGMAARLGARALGDAPAILAAGAAPTGDSVGQLRRSINEAKLSDLLQSDTNKALYQSMGDLGLSGERLDTRFREALAYKAENVTLAGAAASNLLIPGALGAPAERAIAGQMVKPAGRGLVNQGLRSAVGEGGQEAVAAIPDTLSQNAAQAQYTGNEVDLGKGLGTNALLSAGMGALIGGAASGLSKTPAKPVKPGTAGTVTPPVADPVTGAPATNAPPTPAADTGFSNEVIMAAPTGEPVPDDEHTKYATGVAQATAAFVSRPAIKKGVAGWDAQTVLTAAQGIAEKTAGESWGRMTPEQRIEGIEAAATKINKIAKAEDVGTMLQAVRNGMADPAVAASADTTIPTPEAITPAAAFNGAGAGIAAAFYDGAFARLNGTGGSSTVETEPFYPALKAAFDAGQIPDVAAAKAFAQSWTVPVAPAPAPAPAAQQTPAPIVTAPAAPAPIATPPVAPAPITAPAPVAPAPVEATAPVAPTPTSEGSTLPAALAGAKPRYGNGSSQWMPQFESDIDKALYIIGQTTKSKNDKGYRDFLVGQGFKEGELDTISKVVRTQVRQAMEATKGGSALKPATVAMPATNANQFVGKTRAEQMKLIVDPLKATQAGSLSDVTNATNPGTAAPKTIKNPLKKAAKPAPAEKTAPAKVNKLKKAAVEITELADDIGALAAAAAEPAVDTTPKKANKLKKEAAPPKQVAPAKQPGQAKAAPPAKRANSSDSVNSIAPDLSSADKADLTMAMDLAREGDPSALNEMLKPLIEDGEITREQAGAMRKEAASLGVEARGEGTTNKDKIDVPDEETPEVAGVDIDAADGSTRPAPKPTKVGALVERVAASDSKDKAGDLLRAIANGEGGAEVGPMQVWLAKTLAPVVDRVRLGFAKAPNNPEYKNFLGAYDYLANAVWFQGGTADVETVLHEMLHGATSSLLSGKALSPEVRQFQREMDDMLAHVQAYARENTPTGPIAKHIASQRGFLSNVNEFLAYGMTNPIVQDYLATIPAPPGRTEARNSWDAFKGMIAKLYEKFAKAGRMTAQQRSTLDALIETTGGIVQHGNENPIEVVKANMAVAARLSALPIDPIDTIDPSTKMLADAGVDVRSVTRAGRFIELFSRAEYGLERSQQEVRKAGGNVTAENSPDLASRRYTSDIAENRNTDSYEVVEPLRDWITANWQNFDVADVDEFRTDLDKFLQNYHMLNERNPSMWAEQVPLRNGTEAKRTEILADAEEGVITGAEMDRQLIALAKKNGVVDLDTWSKSNGRPPDAAKKILADVATRGFTPEALAELNTDILQPIRDRRRSRLEGAGIVSSEDPYATRSWSWYVPLKGSLAVDDATADFDVGANKGSAKEFRNRNLKLMKGRSTNGLNSLESLVMDLNEAGTAMAEGDFKGTLYEYVLDNESDLGATIEQWEGTPKTGYTNAAGKTTAELKQPKSGFVYNNGKDHFIVTLPEGSQLDRGIKGLKAVVSPGSIDAVNPAGSVLRGVGTATNVMARAYTTWAPEWQLMVGFLRDVQTLPTTIGFETFDSPWKARVFFKEYTKGLISNTLNMKAAGSELKALLVGSRGNLLKAAETNTYIADLLAYRAAGGSTEFSQGLNRERAQEVVFDKARNAGADVMSWETAVKGYDKWNQVTGDWAALLENKGRVAAWKALMATGMDAKEAAAITKGSLDFGQSGEWGKMINVWSAFYRVGATSVDTVRRSLTNKDGSLNKEKIKNWSPFFAAMGVVNYMMLSAMLGDDEDGKARISKYDPDTLTQKMLIPDGKGGVYSTPIGLGLPQLVLAPGMLGAAVAAGDMTMEEAAKAYYKTLTRNTPIQPAGQKKGSGPTGFVVSWLQGLLVPTVARPAFEVATNTNAFDSPIRTSFPSDDKFKSDQGMKTTPEFWKDQAKGLHDTFGIDVFPETIRHYVKAYGGQPANTIIRHTLDLANKEQSGMDSDAVRTALRLKTNDEDFYYSNEARKAYDRLSISKRKANNAADPDKFLRDNPNDSKRIDARKVLDKAQDTYYKRKNAIRENKLMSPQGKKDQMKLNDSKLRDAVNKAEAVIEATK